MKKRQLYSGEFKVKVVLDLIQGEKNLIQLAKEHELHPNQIKNWKSILLRKAIEFMEDKRRRKSPTAGRYIKKQWERPISRRLKPLTQ